MSEPNVSYRVVDEELIWREVEGEAVVVHASTSAYYGVNLSGTLLWKQLAAEATTPEELASSLESHFERDPEQARQEAAAFIEQALREGLVSAVDREGSSEAAPPAEPSTRPAQPYEPPTVTRFGDLETLVLSGE